MENAITTELNAIKAEFGINAEITLGEPSYVSYVRHPIIIHNEGLPCSVEIGYLINDQFTVDKYVAKQANELLQKLEHFVEHGEVEDVHELAFVIMNAPGTYRLHLQTEEDTHQHDFNDIADVDSLLGNELAMAA